jgi:hypothetical protein
MPAYGLIPDSPFIYAGQRLSRSLRRSGSGRSKGRGSSYLSYKLVNVTIFRAKLNIELNTPAGGLWKHLEKKGQKAVAGAKKMVGVKTGALRSSISMEHISVRGGQKLTIGSTKSYALAHHEGTRAHFIIPKPPKTVLVFRKGARIIATPRVLHPGTKANPYLTSQLRHFIE